MAKLQLGLELGSSNTYIFYEGQGVVLCEPSVVSFLDKVSLRTVLDAGYRVKQASGRASDKTIIVSPIREGVIIDKIAAIAMLKTFLGRIVDNKKFLSYISAIVCIPCGLTLQERRDYEYVCLKAGINELILVESVIAAGIGAELNVDKPDGAAVVDIGGGTTDIAVMSMSGIISGCSINVGGKAMDSTIINTVKRKYSLNIGYLTAEKIKEEIGTLYPNDLAEMKISGMDAVTLKPTFAVVTAADVYEAVYSYYNKVAESIESIINVIPPEIAASIYENGINLTGGAAQMYGIEQFLGSRLKVAVKVFTHPEYAVILGAGKLLSDEKLLNSIFEQNN